MQRRLRLGLIVLLAASALWLWWSHRNLERTREDLLAARQSLAAVEQQTQRLNRPTRGTPVAAGERRAGAASAADPKAKLDPRVRALIDNPRLQAAYLAAKRARLDREYAPLFRSLNLSPAQIDRLKGLLMRREEQQLDLALSVPAALRTSNVDFAGQWFTNSLQLAVGGNAHDPDVQAAMNLMQQTNQSLQAAATDLLGPEGWQQLYDYWRALPNRAVTDSLAGSLATSPDPLTPDQANQLTRILSEANGSYAQGKPANLDQENWNQVFQQAKGFLSPPQLSVLQETVAARRTGTEMNNLVRAAAAGP